MSDVAREANVNTSTVSRVLSNRTEGFSVKPEVRQRIMAAAKKLAYRPNPVLRSLRAERTNMVALLGVTPGNPNPGINELAVRGLVTHLNNAGYDVCTSFFSKTHQPFELPPWRVDAAVLVGAFDPSHLRHVEEHGQLYVSINGEVGLNGSSIQVDDAQGTRLVIDHLVDLGHQRIAYVNSSRLPEHNRPVTHRSIAIRENAYIEALRERGLEPLPGHDERNLPDEQRLAQAIERGATAILAYDHVQAIRLMRIAHARGWRIPDDFSLAAFNNVFPVDELTPPLTTVHLPADAMGEAAAQMLLRQLEEGAQVAPAHEHLNLQEDLVVRASTAPVDACGR